MNAFSSRPQALRLTAALGVLLALTLADRARAAAVGVLNYTNRAVDSWMTPTCWSPNTNWATGTWRTNNINNDLRVNVGSLAGAVTLTYDASMGTTTIVETNGADRCVTVGSGVAGAAGTLNLVGGTLRCIPKAGVVAVFLSGLNTMTTTNTLNINGGTLDYATGQLDVLYRASSPAWSRLNVSSGTLLADAISFCGFGDSAVGGRGDVNLNGGTTIVRTIKAGGVAGKTDNAIRTVNLNGGTIQATANSTTLIDPTMPAFAAGSTASFTVNLSNNAATTFNIPTNVTTAIPAPLTGPGGFTKTGAGTLNLPGGNGTFTGPMVVNQGTLGVTLPSASQALALSGSTKLTLGTTNSAWALSSAALTNATVDFYYGSWGVNSYTEANLTVANLALSGTVTVNVTGTGFPATNLTLLTYGSKTGGGAFALGTLPSGAAATLVDDGSRLVLQVTTPSVQDLIWSVGDGNWQTNGAADWNGGTAIYLEYPSGSGDNVFFNDLSAGGTVNIPSVVKPALVTVDDSSATYTFSGPGRISGGTGINKLGLSTLTIANSNDFTGVVSISGGSGVNGGTLYVTHPNALGATNGGTIVAGPANTLELGTPGGPGVTLAGEPVTLNGTGVGGARGALRGTATASGSNVWAGPVILGSNGARIGTEDNGNLTVDGPILSGTNLYTLIVRPGAAGTVTINNAANSYGPTQFYGDGSGTGKLILGAANAISPKEFDLGPGTVDLNGYDQTVTGLGENAGAGTLLNNGAVDCTLTLNGTNAFTYRGPITDGSAGRTVRLVKTGAGLQTLGGQNTYTGSTVVEGGQLAVTLPMSSSALTVADNGALFVTVNNSAWSPTTFNLTNAALTLNYGSVAGVPNPVFTTPALTVSGSNIINVAGLNLPMGPLTLIAYTNNTGGGSFSLGLAPTGMVATLIDTGSAIVLNVIASPQTLTWFGSATGTWNTNATFDWNFGAAFYQEYGNGLGDFVSFDDTAVAFTVTPANDVRPYSLHISNTVNAYTFSGPGRIGGSTALIKQGTNVLTLASPNDYAGGTLINAGILSFTNGALGSNGNIVLAAGTTLQWGGENNQDISSRLRINGASGTPATLDLGTNDVTFHNGVSQNGAGGSISNALTKIGNGKLLLAGGTTALGQVTRINAGSLEVAAGATLTVDGGGTVANAALISDRSTILVTGGTVNVADRLGVATAGNSTGVVTVASGTLTVEIGSTTATRGLRVSGGTSAVNFNSGTVNLDGGTLTVARIFQGLGSTNTSLFNFNGGTLKPSGNPVADTFMTGLTHACVKSGGAILDVGASDLTIGQALENDGVALTDGGLAKLGSGKLTLSGTNTYTGATVVSNGTLWVSGALGTNSVTVNSGATLGSTGVISGPVTVNAGGTLAPGTSPALGEVLTVSGALQLAGTTVLELGAMPTCDSVAGVTDIAYGGTLVVTNATGAPLTAGDVFSLFAASGLKTGNFSAVQVLPANLGLSATFDPATGQLTLANAAPPTLSYANTGAGLQFTWTGNFKLQAQTNSLSLGIGTNWADFPGGGTSGLTVPIDASQGSVFFRLVSP